ncbi:MAG: DUF2232 domain-containing protein [Coprobacillus sp.]
MGRTNTKKMVQGAMIASMFGALSIFNTYTGSMFDIFICYVMVIPLVWYGYQYTVKDNLIVCVVSMFVIFMVGLPFFIISSISSCLAGLFIGEALKRKAKKETILLGTFITSLLNNLLLYEVFAKLLNMDIVSEMTVMYQEISQVVPSLTNQISLDTVLSMIPLFLIVLAILEMYVIIMLCQAVLSRLHVEFPGSFHIATMHLSQKTGLILAAAMFLSYILVHYVKVDFVYLSYIYMLCNMTFVLQGLAFMCYFVIMKQKPKFMFLFFIGLFIPFSYPIYTVFGIIDIFSDLRANILYNNNI